jgi:hypothetical protein
MPCVKGRILTTVDSSEIISNGFMAGEIASRAVPDEPSMVKKFLVRETMYMRQYMGLSLKKWSERKTSFLALIPN